MASALLGFSLIALEFTRLVSAVEMAFRNGFVQHARRKLCEQEYRNILRCVSLCGCCQHLSSLTVKNLLILPRWGCTHKFCQFPITAGGIGPPVNPMKTQKGAENEKQPAKNQRRRDLTAWVECSMGSHEWKEKLNTNCLATCITEGLTQRNCQVITFISL